MSRVKLAGIVTRKSEVEGKPCHSVELRCGEVYIFKKIQQLGSRGITCGDFKGDLRHYIRNLKQKGVGLREEWEQDAFGQHKRWFLKEGHSFEEIPYVSKKNPAKATTIKQGLNPNSNTTLEGGIDADI